MVEGVWLPEMEPVLMLLIATSVHRLLRGMRSVGNLCRNAQAFLEPRKVRGASESVFASGVLGTKKAGRRKAE